MSCTCLSELYNSPSFQADMSALIDGLDQAASEFSSQVDSITEELTSKVDYVQGLLDKAECFAPVAGILPPTARPALKGLIDKANSISEKIQTGLEIKNLVGSSVGILVNEVKNALGSIPLPELRSKLEPAFSAIKTAQEVLSEAKGAYEFSKNALDKALDVLNCASSNGSFLGEKDTEDLNSLLQRGDDLFNKISEVNQKIDSIENLISGSGCIDITC